MRVISPIKAGKIYKTLTLAQNSYHFTTKYPLLYIYAVSMSKKNEWNAKAAAKENKFRHTKGKLIF